MLRLVRPHALPQDCVWIRVHTFRHGLMTCQYHHPGERFLSFCLKMDEDLFDVTRCCEVFLWHQALYSGRLWFLITQMWDHVHSVQVFYIHYANNFNVLQTHDFAWHLDWYFSFKGHSGNHFHYMECVLSNHSPNAVVKVFSYILDMDIRIDI